jgi:hypothetical protein
MRKRLHSDIIRIKIYIPSFQMKLYSCSNYVLKVFYTMNEICRANSLKQLNLKETIFVQILQLNLIL